MKPCGAARGSRVRELAWKRWSAFLAATRGQAVCSGPCSMLTSRPWPPATSLGPPSNADRVAQLQETLRWMPCKRWPSCSRPGSRTKSANQPQGNRRTWSLRVRPAGACSRGLKPCSLVVPSEPAAHRGPQPGACLGQLDRKEFRQGRCLLEYRAALPHSEISVLCSYSRLKPD